MARPAAAGLLAALLAVTACGDVAASLLEGLGVRTLRRVPAEEARDALASGRARLVQRRAPEERLPRLAGAAMLRDDEPPPATWAQEPTAWLAVADDPEAAVALAARLRRAGLRRVGVVTGDPRSLGDARTARAAQPATTRDHPSPEPHR